MAILDGLKKQLRSVIQWDDPDLDTMFFRWTDSGDEIKNASKLIVGPGQGCIFVYKGKVQAILQRQGMVDLKTANIPFWTTVSRFMQYFQSEHKVALYFFRRTKFLNQKWGTSSVIKYEDPKYKFPVGLRAFGNFSFLIADPEHLLSTVIGGSSLFQAKQMSEVMVDRITQPLSDYLAECKYSYSDIDSHREEVARDIHAKLEGDFKKLGIEITDFRIEGTNFDDETLKRINRIADMTAEAHAAAAVGMNYAQVQQIEAMRDAAKNEGGGAGLGMGMGAGLGFGQMMAGAMHDQQTAPESTPEDEMAVKLRKLQQLFENGLINEQEYSEKKKEILARL